MALVRRMNDGLRNVFVDARSAKRRAELLSQPAGTIAAAFARCGALAHGARGCNHSLTNNSLLTQHCWTIAEGTSIISKQLTDADIVAKPVADAEREIIESYRRCAR